MLEELEYKALSKFTILHEPLQIFPMRCAGCGRYSSGDPANPLQFIDMGFEVEFHGQVLICIDGCFREVMNQLGVLTKEQTNVYRTNLETTEAEINKLQEENRGLRDAVAALNRISSDSSSSVSSVASVEREEEKSVVSAKSSVKSTGRKEGPVKQTNERGSSDLSSNASNDLLGEI